MAKAHPGHFKPGNPGRPKGSVNKVNQSMREAFALAFERISDGKVLLFPGDAQQGNWLSWHAPSMRWTIPGSRGSRTVTAADLLARTVFYKVGHHASHNATARAKGLELMTSPELTAFIPVDRAVDRLVAGLAGDAFEITFPRRFALILKLLRLLPYRLYFPLIRARTGR